MDQCLPGRKGQGLRMGRHSSPSVAQGLGSSPQSRAQTEVEPYTGCMAAQGIRRCCTTKGPQSNSWGSMVTLPATEDLASVSCDKRAWDPCVVSPQVPTGRNTDILTRQWVLGLLHGACVRLCVHTFVHICTQCLSTLMYAHMHAHTLCTGQALRILPLWTLANSLRVLSSVG